MKREDVYNATVWQVNRETERLAAWHVIEGQIKEMQIEIPFSIKKRIIFEVIPARNQWGVTQDNTQECLERIYQKQSTK